VDTTCDRQRIRSGRPAKKLHVEGILFGVVHHFLNRRWSPEQIALTLASIYTKGHELATTKGIDAGLMGDLMMQAVENWSGANGQPPKTIE
jgi:hypothetical protein